jgi:hypothetical protein
MRIGELLVAARLASPQDVDAALRTQAQYGGRLGSILVDLGVVDLDALAATLGRQHGVPAVTSRQLAAIEQAVLAKIPRKAAERCHAIPVAMPAPRQLVVAFRDPRDLAAVDAVQVVAGMRVVPYAAAELQIERALERHYGVMRADDRFVRLSAPTRRTRDSEPPSSARRPRATGLSMPAMASVVAPSPPTPPVARTPSAPEIPRFAPPPRFAAPPPPPPPPPTPPSRARSAFEDFLEFPEPTSRPASRPPAIEVGHLVPAEERRASSLPPDAVSLSGLLVADQAFEEEPEGASEEGEREEPDELRHVYDGEYEREIDFTRGVPRDTPAVERERYSSLPADAILGPATELPPLDPTPAPVSLPRRAAPPETPLHLSLSPAAPPARGSVPPPRRVAEGGYRALSLPPEEIAPRRSEPPPRGSTPPPARASTPPPHASPAPFGRDASANEPLEGPTSLRPSLRPRAAAARPTYDLGQARERIAGSVTKEGVANAISAYLRGGFDCGLVMVIRDGAALGWRGFAPGLEEDALEAVAVPLAQPSPLRAAHDGNHRVVEAPDDAVVQRLLKLLGVPHATEIVVEPVAIRGRVVNLLLGVASAPVPRALLDGLGRVAEDAAAAYVRLIKNAR